MRFSSRAAAIVAFAALVTGCSSAPAAGGDDAPTGELRIVAAASLTTTFDELARAFAAEHPGLTVLPITYDGSSTLATQLLEGAPADVFAAADEATMARVDSLLAGPAATFAHNTLTIAVAPGNPLGISTLGDLAGDVQFVLCAPEVPCGASARSLLRLDGVTATPASEEQNVAAVLTKVRLGEADAGLVYVTDVASAGDTVEGVAIAGAERASNSYPIGVLADAANPDAAAAFAAWVLSPAGQRILAEHGFGAP